MSNIIIASLPQLSREALASRLQTLDQPLSASSPIAIVDVRGSDYVGGHIRGCTNVPAGELDYRTPELVRKFKDKELVVFHCALSQQRGPAAALRYLRERERLLLLGSTEKKTSDVEREGRTGNEDGGSGQQVYVLEGGFVKWQEKYGADEKLTEGWQKDVWEFGY